MEFDKYEEMIKQARQLTKERISIAKAKFGLGTYRCYEIDLQAATIYFYDDNGIERVHADIQVAGSWSSQSENFWLWAWDNESVPQRAFARMGIVRAFGEKNNIKNLRASFVHCDEGEAWSMASIAAQLLNAQCVYRVDRPRNYLFLLLFSIVINQN